MFFCSVNRLDNLVKETPPMQRLKGVIVEELGIVSDAVQHSKIRSLPTIFPTPYMVALFHYSLS